MATDPLFLSERTALAVDNAPYRAGRMLLPVGAWLASFGRAELAARLYVVLCWAMALAAVVALGRWQRAEGGAPEWSLAIAFAGGVVASVVRALPDAAAMGLVVLALRAHARGRVARSLALDVAAVFCRETSILASLSMALVDLRARRWRAGLAHLALPLLALGFWRLWLHWRVGPLGTGVVDKHFGLPFAGLSDKVFSFASQTPIGQLADLLGLAAVLLAVAAAAPLIWRWRRWQALEATYVAFAAVALMLSIPVYFEPFAYSRVLVLLPILGLPLAAREDASVLAWLVRGAAILGAFGGFVLLWIDLAPALRRLLV